MAYMYAEEMELLIAQHELEQMNDGITNLMAIYDHVTKFGVSDALKDLVGEASLEEFGISVYNVPASKDTVDTTAKDVTPKAAPPSLLKRILAGIKKVFNKIFEVLKKIYDWVKDKFVKMARWFKTKFDEALIKACSNLTSEQLAKLKLPFSPKEFAAIVSLAIPAFSDFSDVSIDLLQLTNDSSPSHTVTEDDIKTVLTNKAPNYERLIPMMEQFRNKLIDDKELTGVELVKDLARIPTNIDRDFYNLTRMAEEVNKKVDRAADLIKRRIAVMELTISVTMSDIERANLTEQVRMFKMVVQVISELSSKYGSIWSGINRCMGMLCSLIKQIQTFQYSNLKSEEEKARFRKQYNFNPAGATA